MPESPRYLVTAGRKREALEILRKIAKENKRDMPAEDIATAEVPVSKIIFSSEIPPPYFYQLISAVALTQNTQIVDRSPTWLTKYEP